MKFVKHCYKNAFNSMNLVTLVKFRSVWLTVPFANFEYGIVLVMLKTWYENNRFGFVKSVTRLLCDRFKTRRDFARQIPSGTSVKLLCDKSNVFNSSFSNISTGKPLATNAFRRRFNVRKHRSELKPMLETKKYKQSFFLILGYVFFNQIHKL